MPASDESDELPLSHASLLAGTNLRDQSSLLPSANSASWSFPDITISKEASSRDQAESAVAPMNTHRSASRSTSELENPSTAPSIHQASLFSTPNQSIFSSGPPTTSVSANTAYAMSGSHISVPSHPLSALATSSSSKQHRSVHYQSEELTLRNSQILQPEKENDDPSTPLDRSRVAEGRGSSTPTAVTRLFATVEPETPTISRHASYVRTVSGTTYTRASHETASLPSHLLARGLTEGRHSDITIHAFGTQYALHRLLLDRAPYFSSMLSGPWSESSKKDVTLEVEDLDSNITQAAFELTLRRLYGCSTNDDENLEAIGLFATGCWLEMNDLIESSVSAILRQMVPSNLGSLIRLVTRNYYGTPGDRILASAKAMLCKEGWEMPLKYWDNVPGEIIREVIGNDGFFVLGEWERWLLAKRVFNRKLKLLAIEAGLIDSSGHHKRSPPDTMIFNAIRFDAVYRKSMPFASNPTPEVYDPWLALYTCPDIAALLVLLDEGIHYIHLSFEQLKKIKEQRDILGLPLMPEGVISNSLWTQMELRQKVLNANELQQELGLTIPSEYRDEYKGFMPASDPQGKAASVSKGKQAEIVRDDYQDDEMESGSWDGNGRPRKFWVPNIDHTSVVGGNTDPLTSEASRPYTPRHLSRLSANIEPQDVQWASDLAATIGERPQTPGSKMAETQSMSYSLFPPFRFAAEFPNPRSLKEKKRVYSRTVWYAGSYWNVYIQKVETSKNTQLGVYLHRAKDNNDDDGRHSSVDERIGQVELLMRRNQRQRQQQQRQTANARTDVEEDGGMSSGDPDATLIPTSVETTRNNAISSLLRGDPIPKSSQNQLPLPSVPDPAYNSSLLSDTDDPYASFDYSFGTSSHGQGNISTRRSSVVPPYVDARPTIRTYFKIFSPSKGGRMIATYESAPDRFNFSQSWGWKSSTMILDDGFPGYDGNNDGRETKGSGRLRFMVVIGELKHYLACCREESANLKAGNV